MDIDIFQLPAIVMRRMRYVVVAAALFAALGFAFVVNQPNLFRASTQILLDPQGLSAVGQSASDPSAAGQAQQSIDSQIYVMQSRDVLVETVRALGLQRDPFFLGRPGLIKRLLGKTATPPASEEEAVSTAAGTLGNNLIITRSDQSLVFNITAQHPDPQRAAEIANKVSSVYLDRANKVSADKSLRASMSLQEQAGELRKRLLEAEDKVEKFRSENGLVSTGTRGLVSDQQLEGVSTQLLTAKSVLEQQEANYEQVQALSADNLDAGAIPEALQQTSVTAMRSRYAQMVDHLAELETHLGARHPQLQTARSQAASMRKQLEAEIARVQESVRNTYERAKANVTSLQERFDALQSASGESGDARTRLNQLQSEATAIRGVYTSFLTRAEELSRQYDIGSGNSRIISEALAPGRGTRVSSLLVAIAGLLFGAAVGSVLAVARELLDGKSLSERQIVDILGAPIVARVAPLGDEPRTTSGGRLSRLRQRLPRRLSARLASIRRSPAPANQVREAGVTRAAYFLSEALADALPATLVFVGPGRERPDLSVVAEISASLGDTGAVVDFAIGAVASASPLAGTLRQMHGAGIPVFDTLSYQRLQIHVSARAQNRAAGSLLSTVSPQSVADYTVVDASGLDGAGRLIAFLKGSDAVMVVVKLGQTSRAELRDLAVTLEPWKSKMLGSLVIEGRH